MIISYCLFLAINAVALFSDFGLANSIRSSGLTITLKKNRVIHKQNRHVKETAVATSHSSAVKLRNIDDIYYTGLVEVGKPGQRFTVVFDSGSSDFWVLSRTICDKDKSFCDAHNTYHRKCSSSVLSEHRNFSIVYGSGAVSGELFKDDVTIANLKIKGQVVGEARVIDDALKKFQFDGILGLGLPGLSRFNATPPFINMVKQGLIANPVFALYLGRSRSELVLGGVNPNHYRGKFTFTQVYGDRFWLFHVDKVMVGKVTVSKVFPATPDSGTSFVIGPPAIIDPINAKIYKTDKDGNTYVDCDNLDSLPNVVFFINGQQFVLSPHDYIQEVTESGKRQCFSGFDNSVNEMIILGDIFMTKYYTQFDAGQKRIGFAEARK